MTRFCEVVTPGDKPAVICAARLVTKELGEAMAPAPATPPSGGIHAGAGAAPIAMVLLLALALAGCGDDVRPLPRATAVAAPDRAAADPARGVTTELDGPAPALAAAVLAELTGDTAAARAGFEHVLAAADAPPALAAGAALHLARLEARAGKSHRALELAARAQALAPSDPAIAEGVAELQADLVAAAGTGDVRGPRIGTPLPGVEPAVAAAFADAERALAQVHRLQPRPVVEALSSSIRVKENATEDAVARYRAVAEHGGVARIAASYRAGSLYHDLALGLLFELPPELDATVAAGLRRTLRGRAIAYLKKAVAEYRAALAARPPAADAHAGTSAGTSAGTRAGSAVRGDDDRAASEELWRLAAEADLRGARDLLGEAGEP